MKIKKFQININLLFNVAELNLVFNVAEEQFEQFTGSGEHINLCIQY